LWGEEEVRLPSLIREVWSNLVRKPATVKYPFKKLTPSPQFRGRHRLLKDRCTGCGLCAEICPAFAISLVEVEGSKTISIDLGKCIFCYQCEDVCPRGAIRRSDVFEMATWIRDDLLVK